MSISLRRSTLLFGILLLTFASGWPTLPAESPVGNWTGVVRQPQRNIVVKLTVSSLEEGARSGEMRLGTPRTCVLQTEYSGMNESLYTFNISGTNGGWCDLYRDGSLVLEMSQHFISFTLADKTGANKEQGTLVAVRSGVKGTASAKDVPRREPAGGAVRID